LTGGAKWVLRNVTAHLCAIGVAAYFLYAAYPKIEYPRQFALDIKNYQILPEQYLNLAALYLPWVEIVAAAALIIPKTRRTGAVLIVGMLLMFIFAVSYAAFYKGLDINCGCTGNDSAKAGWSTIILDVSLLAATAGAVYLPVKRKSRVADYDAFLGGAAK